MNEQGDQVVALLKEAFVDDERQSIGPTRRVWQIDTAGQVVGGDLHVERPAAGRGSY